MTFRSSHFRLIIFIITLVAFQWLSQTRSVAAVPLAQANLLQNPGFEEPYSNGTALGWSPWHQGLNDNPKPANCSERYMVRPSWNGELATGELIKEGARSQQVGNNFDTWRAGVFQNINVNPGSTYRFTFYATGRASNDQYPAPSDAGVNLGVRGGIDPNGSGLWSDGDIVWGASGSPHMGGSQGNWQQFSVEATAAGPTISVFVQADTGGVNQCRRHLDVWFDQAQLIEAGPPPTSTRPPPPPPPPATNTPIPPTSTPTPEVTPTATLLPTLTPTFTPEPPKTGVICVNAFADNNSNGQRDPEEGYMAGVTFTIAQNNQVVAQGVSTGTASPICFENIPPGQYTVAQVVPRNLEMTTAPSAQIDVSAGATISLEFGSRIRSDIDGEEVAGLTPTPGGQNPGQEGSTADDDGVNPLAIVGLVAILLAIVLLGALIIILLRQSRSA